MRRVAATLAEFLGIGLVVYGAWLVSRPAGYILGGVIVIVYANIADVQAILVKRLRPEAES